MTDQQQKQQDNIESCKRMQALAEYRESEGDLFQAISVLNDALFYLNPKSFTQEQFMYVSELRTQIMIKQVQLCLNLQKPKRAILIIQQLIKTQNINTDVEKLIEKLKIYGIKNEDILRESIVA